MMRIRVMSAALGMAAGVCFGAVGTGTNAALEYYRTWGVMDGELATVLLPGDTLKLAAGGEARLVESDETVGSLLESARSGSADWGIDLSEGPEVLLPHLGNLRASAKIMTADALRCAAAGDDAGAAERAGAVFRMSLQSRDDGTLISSLVGMAIGNLGVTLTEQMIAEGVIGAEEAGIVLDGIRSGGMSDRYAFGDAIVGEWRMMSEFVVRNAPEKDAGVWLRERLAFADDAAGAEKLLKMDRSELMRELGGYAEYHADLLAAWTAQDKDAMEAAEQRVQSGAYGVLTEMLGVSMTRAYGSDLDSEARLQALIEKLEGIRADG